MTVGEWDDDEGKRHQVEERDEEEEQEQKEEEEGEEGALGASAGAWKGIPPILY